MTALEKWKYAVTLTTFPEVYTWWYYKGYSQCEYCIQSREMWVRLLSSGKE